MMRFLVALFVCKCPLEFNPSESMLMGVVPVGQLIAVICVTYYVTRTFVRKSLAIHSGYWVSITPFTAALYYLGLQGCWVMTEINYAWSFW